MTIEKYNRSGGYKYVAYDNDGKVLIITSSKIALKAAYCSINSAWVKQCSGYEDQADLYCSVPHEWSLTRMKAF